MESIQVTFQTILAFFGALAVAAGGIKVIVQALSPFKELKAKVAVCEERLNKHDLFFKNDNTEIDDLKKLTRENLRVNIALLNHFIDGNGVDKMKELRSELEQAMLEG